MRYKQYTANTSETLKSKGGFSARAMLRRAVALLLILSSLLTLIACGKSEQADVEEKQAKLTLENTRIGTDTLALDLGQYPLAGEAACRIAPAINAPALEGADIRAYSFEIDTQEELLSVMELTIPYDDAALGGQGASNNIAAAYYNEDTGAWEPVPFRINEDTKTVTIYTDHLSVYGCFEVTDPNTRKAYAAYAIPAFALTGMMGSANANDIITTAVKNGGAPGNDAVEAGLSILDNAFNVGVAGMDAAAFFVGLGGSDTAAAATLLGDIGKRLGDLGLICSVAQVGYGMYNIYNGKRDAVFPCYANALKTGVGYSAGKFGARLFSVAMVGVLAIEYSINTFAKEALSGRKDIYKEAYRLYYDSPGVKRSARDWAALLIKAKEGASSADRYQLRVEGLVERYAQEFWSDELRVAQYQAEAQKHGFTGGGGLNERIKSEITKDFTLELYRGVLQDAFSLIAQKEALAAERALLLELNALKAKLNTPCTLELYDASISEEKPLSHLGGFRAAIKLPDTVEDAQEWSAILDKEGNGNIKFTLLAYIMANAPDTLEIYEPDKDSEHPAAEFQFALEKALVRLDIGKELLPLEELLGYHEGSITIADVFVSQEIKNRAENDPIRFDSNDLDFHGDCDATLLAMLEGAIGETGPCTIRIQSEDPQSGKASITLYLGEDGDKINVEAHYANGVFTIGGDTTYSQGYYISLPNLYASKDANGAVYINGALEAWPPDFEKDLRMDMSIKTKRG